VGTGDNVASTRRHEAKGSIARGPVEAITRAYKMSPRPLELVRLRTERGAPLWTGVIELLARPSGFLSECRGHEVRHAHRAELFVLYLCRAGQVV
jgi:hypothetical protein